MRSDYYNRLLYALTDKDCYVKRGGGNLVRQTSSPIHVLKPYDSVVYHPVTGKIGKRDLYWRKTKVRSMKKRLACEPVWTKDVNFLEQKYNLIIRTAQIFLNCKSYLTIPPSHPYLQLASILIECESIENFARFFFGEGSLKLMLSFFARFKQIFTDIQDCKKWTIFLLIKCAEVSQCLHLSSTQFHSILHLVLNHLTVKEWKKEDKMYEEAWFNTDFCFNPEFLKM